MDREMLKRHLALSEEHIATAEKNISRQRNLIAQLERDGHDTASARTFLREFEQLQALHIAERERLLSELERVSRPNIERHERSRRWLWWRSIVPSRPVCALAAS
jgi:hypothetical protein